MKLSELSGDVFSSDSMGETEISCVTDRCGRMRPGGLFVAVHGHNFNGHTLLRQAASLGAAAAVVSEEVADPPLPCFRVEDSRKALALLCRNFFGDPGKKLSLTGITGTNGKTSTAYLLEHCLQSCGCRTGMIGTVEIHNGISRDSSGATTPEPEELYRILSEMVQNGCTHAVLEVSSQSLDQRRVDGLRFDVGIFTNLTVDHLDYHGSMQAYRDAKLRLFDLSEKKIVNADSDYSAAFLQPGALSFSAVNPAVFSARRIRMGRDGVRYLEASPSGEREVFLPLWGKFSVYNSLAALAAAESLGLDANRCAASLANFPGVRGRLEHLCSGLPFRLLCDYAHTPDGLENTLRTVREMTPGQVIVVFGCGGDRDRSKRPEMGRIATELADFSIITSDNPRSENPETILRQIEAGVSGGRYQIIENRTEAIRYAIRMAKRGDTVLLAGKGHETYQILADRVLRYDEREIVREILKEEGF